MSEDTRRRGPGGVGPEPPDPDEAADGAGDVSEETMRRRVEEGLERLVPEVVKRTVEAGIGTLSDRGLRGLRLPKEVARYLFAQVDETKNALLRVVAHEVREFLEETDLAEVLRSALTSVSLEISTRVSFVPSESGSGVRPEVDSKARVAPARRKPKGARRSAEGRRGGD